MLSNKTKDNILTQMEKEGIVDVYFCKDRLYVLNEWDVPTVEKFLQKHPSGGSVIVVTTNDEAYTF